MFSHARPLMGAEMAARGTAIVTLVASKWLLARVRQLMGTEMAALGAAIVAQVASKRLLARMHQLMGAETAALGAAIVALVADKRLLARVRPLMGAEIAAPGAAIVALVAGKRLLARVRPLMAAEIAALCAAIVALVAGKRLLGRQRPLGYSAERLVARRSRRRGRSLVTYDRRSSGAGSCRLFLPVFVQLDQHEHVRNEKVALEHVVCDGASQRPLVVRCEICGEGSAFKGHAIRCLHGIDKGRACDRSNELGGPHKRLGPTWSTKRTSAASGRDTLGRDHDTIGPNE
jgi:hypothetical protein